MAVFVFVFTQEIRNTIFGSCSCACSRILKYILVGQLKYLCVFARMCAFVCVFLYVLAPSPLSSWSHQQGMLDLASVTV